MIAVFRVKVKFTLLKVGHNVLLGGIAHSAKVIHTETLYEAQQLIQCQIVIVTGYLYQLHDTPNHWVLNCCISETNLCMTFPNRYV